MPTEALRTLLDIDADRLERLWAEFGRDDPDRFVAWLHAQGHIDHDTFVAVESGGPVRVAGLDTIGLLPEDSISHELDNDGLLEGYTLLGPVGRGGVGEVLVVREHDLGRRVALKRLLPHVVDDREVMARFYREVQITAQLEHPGILPVYRFEQSRGELAYTMKLVVGETLKDLLRSASAEVERTGRAPVAFGLPARLRLFVRACEAVDYAHSAGVMHRDLKPSNIMRGRFGEVYVLDWGVARRVSDAAEPGGAPRVERLDGDDVTQLGAALGTPAYMAPEQAFGEEVGFAADQYALGLILQELATLRRARVGLGATVLLDEARLGERLPLVPAEGLGRLDRELIAIVDRACDPEPARRYPSVAALAADVQRYMDGEEITALPDGPVRWIERRLVRHRHVTLFALLALGLGFFATVSSTLYRGRNARIQLQQEQQKLDYVLALSGRQNQTVLEQLLGLQAQAVALGASSEMALRLGRPDLLDGPIERALDDPGVSRVRVGLAGGESIVLPPEVGDESEPLGPWYRQAIGQRGAVVGDPTHGPDGWSLPISVALAEGDQLVGVAAIELDLDRLGAGLGPDGLHGVRGAIVTDTSGRVVASGASWIPVGEVLPDDEVVSWVERRAAGKFERPLAGGTELVMVYRVDFADWSYVLFCDLDAMLAGG